MADTSITQLIKRIVRMFMPSITTGVVTCTDPLEIVQMDDIGIILHDQSLVIPEEYKPIEKGDEFYLLSLNNNKIYLIVGRV